MIIFHWKFQRICIAFLFIIFAILNSNAQNNKNDYRLLLKAGTVDIEENIQKIVDEKSLSNFDAFENKYYCFLQFYDIPLQNQREQIEQSGIELLEYLPNYTYAVSIPEKYDLRLLKSYNVRAVFNLEPIYKLDEQLHAHPYPDWAVFGDKQIDVVVQYHKNIEPKTIKEYFANEDVEIISSNDYSSLITLRIKTLDITKFAGLQFVSYVSAIPSPPVPDDTKARALHRTNVISSDNPMGRHYDGNGVVCAIADDGAIGPHIDFTGRLTQHTVSYGGTHGDMTSGILMGAGNLNPLYKGMATGAHLQLYRITGYPHIVNAPANLTNLGTVITSTSYSQQCGGVYTPDSRAIDQQIRQNPSIIHVFSAGNNGNSNCGYGAGSGWGNITGGYKAAKNVIACGNLNYLGVLENSSSRGPADDGRIKPDICSNGINQMSTDPNNGYSPGGGTSAAAPGIAGIVAQLYHAYRDLNGNSNPETSLIKACMLNSAEDLGTPGPDFEYGWGRVNALRAVKTLEEVNYIDSSIVQNATHSYTLNMPPGVKQVKIMMYWLDYEGASNASKALVNNLNLQVKNPSLVIFNPWILNHAPNPNTLDDPAVRGVDSINNVEQVTIDNPGSGSFTITVNGYQVPQGPQKYHIVYEFITDDIEITYPIGGEGLAPGDNTVIHWDAYGTIGDFSIDYSTDNGLTWNVIDTSVNGSQRHYLWTVPNVQTGKALMRVTRGTVSDTSYAAFSIMPIPSNLNVDWACPDSCLFSWDSIPGATSYEISMLGNKYMDSLATSSATSFIVKNINPIDDYWFSVKAKGQNNAVSRRAIAYNKNPGVWNCILSVDAEITKVSPLSTTLPDCHDYSSMDVDIIIKNNGLSNISNVSVNYKLNNNAPVSETYTGIIIPGDSASHTFATAVNLSSVGAHNLVAWLSYNSDGNHYNDTSKSTIYIVAGTVLSLDTSEYFETFSLCSEANTCEAISCVLKNGWTNVTNYAGDDIDWRTNTGGTNSNTTGPSGDHTSGSGRYIYLEASGECTYKEAQLISPCFNLANSNHPVLDFWYHMYGSNMGKLHVDILDGSEWNLDVMSPLVINAGNIWKNKTVDLSNYIGKIINVRFRGITGAGYRSDIALDDISVIETSGDGIEDKLLNSKIQIYPNPGNGIFNLSLIDFNEYKIDIVVTDLQGRTIITKHIDNVSEFYNTEIDLSAMSDGIYIIRLFNDNFVHNRKIIIETK